MQTLIIKLGAAGDVVRTTTLLHALEGPIDWVVSEANAILLRGAEEIREVIVLGQHKGLAGRHYDLVINLEDSAEACSVLKDVHYDQLYGAYLDDRNELKYTDSSRGWFDLGVISRFGIQQADQLKWRNRRSFQELLFEGLGMTFHGECYVLPSGEPTGLTGDIAIAAQCGKVWPMKNWAHFDELKARLESDGLTVNYLSHRPTMRHHLSDVAGHRFLICGDTLPMHFALGLGIPTLAIFNCTSPWEIYDYGILEKVISPRLKDFFYRRDYDEAAVRAVSLEEVHSRFQKAWESATNPAASG